jgi:hypothetical protein
MPRPAAFSRAIDTAVSATSTPRTRSPRDATCRAFSPVPHPASRTVPANAPRPPDAPSPAAVLQRPRAPGHRRTTHPTADPPAARDWLAGARRTIAGSGCGPLGHLRPFPVTDVTEPIVACSGHWASRTASRTPHRSCPRRDRQTTRRVLDVATLTQRPMSLALKTNPSRRTRAVHQPRRPASFGGRGPAPGRVWRLLNGPRPTGGHTCPPGEQAPRPPNDAATSAEPRKQRGQTSSRYTISVESLRRGPSFKMRV